METTEIMSKCTKCGEVIYYHKPHNIWYHKSNDNYVNEECRNKCVVKSIVLDVSIDYNFMEELKAL